MSCIPSPTLARRRNVPAAPSGRRVQQIRIPRTCCLLAAVLLAGCAHLGPRTVAVDRFDYSTAIADSWKRQTLLNIIKIRYMDLPVFLDVLSVVSGYSMQTGVDVGGTLSSEQAVQGDFASIGGQAIYTDRPTITYVPMADAIPGIILPRLPMRGGIAVAVAAVAVMPPAAGSHNRSSSRVSAGDT
jgi:hypothetical protein